MSGSGPGRREVAYRLFAAEFDDAEFSYSESDEERAPNYVVTPTGARVNRLFAVGVLTEVDDVNPEMVRGRVVDPTGAFVTYAGQYQPDALAFLERADPPTFVALSGKARTFEPDDDDVIYSSVRPESVSEVDAETRDRWVVAAAERTLERVGVMAAAIEADLGGDQLRAALVEADVDERLADGVALALEYYDTTPAYLGALRRMALDAARVVAGERDEVDRLDVAPDAAGGAGAATASELATLELSGAPSPATAAAAADAGGATEPDTAPTDTSESIAVSEPSASTDSTTESASEPETDDTADAGDETDAESDSVVGDRLDSSADDEPDSMVDDQPEPTADEGADVPTDDEPGTTDDGDGLGEIGTDDGADQSASPATAGTDDPAADAGTETDDDDPGDFDPGEFDLDEETRQEVEEEFGTEFSTADEVEEAEIETPDPEPAADEADPDPGSADEPATGGTEADDPADAGADDEPADAASEDGAVEEGEATNDEATAEDVDLEDAVMDAMETVGDGDGAEHEALVAAVVDEYGVDPEAVEDAIQEALMSGRCYEPSDGTLKAI